MTQDAEETLPSPLPPDDGLAEEVLASAGAHLFEAADSADAHALLQAAFLPASRIVRAFPEWPVVRLPLFVAAELGVARETAVELATAAVLFFASADVIDDAQDGDLDPEAFGEGWQQAVNAGNALIFLSRRVAVEAAPAHAAPIARAFDRAGLAMCLGQRRDLAQRGALDSDVTEADYLACLLGKTGGSFRLFASLGALASEGDTPVAAALGAFGEALGMALQLASDLGDLCAQGSRDRRNHLLTLPVIQAWARLGPDDRPMLEAAWAGEPDAPPMAFLLERSGAASYSRMRLAVLKTEAQMALEGAGLPTRLQETLHALVDAVASTDSAGLA